MGRGPAEFRFHGDLIARYIQIAELNAGIGDGRKVKPIITGGRGELADPSTGQ
jgi:hypothetical protein